MWLPTIDNILLLHQKMAEQSGGSSGVREIGLIESALARGQAAFGDVELYPAIEQKAAAIGCGLTKNHGFLDGNKRIGMATMLLILRRNGVLLSYTQEELIALGLAVAQGAADVEEMTAWIQEHEEKQA
ncbi:MAG: type II toxin-antitoxin system death-on-curing family toxin [Clostridia bacterium]|nr:type II toxin-antitoxin system death-on-curing family toxin [Clostridia bacterium]